MLIAIFLLFLLLYFFSPWKDRFVFKKSGWLYLISHYQMFMLGVVSMFLLFFYFIWNLVYSIFFYNSIHFFFSFFLFIMVFPFSLESISYGLFGTSFFLEGFVRAENSLSKKRGAFLLPFCNFYVRVIYCFMSLVFFIFSYFFLFCFYVFFIWSFINKNHYLLIFDIFLNKGLFYCFCSIIFFLPYFVEIFNYGLKKSSYFKNFSDY